MAQLQVDIITPDRRVYSEAAKAIRAPGYEGYFGVLPGHTPFVVVLKIGEIKVEENGKTIYFSTSGGFAEVFPDKVSILAETAEAAQSVDLKRAEAAKERAEKRLQEGRKSWDVDRARAALARAINRIAVAGKK